MSKSNFPITIVGFGSQAKAWALNLKDSQNSPLIALRKGSSNRALAEQLGFQVIDLGSKEFAESSLIVLLTPDDQQAQFLNDYVSTIRPQAHLVYAHGFSVSKFELNKKYPQFTHSLLAPKAIASEVRYQYEVKGKIGAAYCVENAEAEKTIRELSKLVGFTALYASNFDEETKADLFSEQSLLCSILPYVALKSFKTLRANGISKEVAFMECFLELQSISKTIVTLGPQAFFKLISPNALIGAQKGRKLLLGKEFDASLEILIRDILNQDFYKEVEVDADKLREEVLAEWEKEELTHVFKELKNDLIN